MKYILIILIGLFVNSFVNAQPPPSNPMGVPLRLTQQVTEMPLARYIAEGSVVVMAIVYLIIMKIKAKRRAAWEDNYYKKK